MIPRCNGELLTTEGILATVFQSIRTALLAVFLVLAFLLGVIVYGSIHTSPPTLPSTTMRGLRLDTYVYSLEKLREASEDNPVSIALSPAETSFLLEKVPPDFRWGRFEYIDAYLESSGDRIRVLAVFQGPMGLYYKLDFQGTARYADARWTVRTEQLSIGKIPIGWFVSSPKVYEGEAFPSDRIQFLRATLDGRGLRADVTQFNVGLSDVIEAD